MTFSRKVLSYLKARTLKRFRYERDDLRTFLKQRKYLYRQKLGLPHRSLVGSTYRYPIKLAQQYPLKPYAGNIFVVRAKERQEDEIFVEKGWSVYVEEVIGLNSEGGHRTMFNRPYVAALAQQVDGILPTADCVSSAAPANAYQPAERAII